MMLELRLMSFYQCFLDESSDQNLFEMLVLSVKCYELVSVLWEITKMQINTTEIKRKRLSG